MINNDVSATPNLTANNGSPLTNRDSDETAKPAYTKFFNLFTLGKYTFNLRNSKQKAIPKRL